MTGGTDRSPSGTRRARYAREVSLCPSASGRAPPPGALACQPTAPGDPRQCDYYAGEPHGAPSRALRHPPV